MMLSKSAQALTALLSQLSEAGLREGFTNTYKFIGRDFCQPRQ